MNHMRQQIAERREAPERRFHLSLKKKNQVFHEGKENDVNSVNRNLEIYNHRSKELENSPTDSQNYILRLSDEFSTSGAEKKFPCYHRANELRIIQPENNLTVSISDSNNSSSRDNSPRVNLVKKKFSRIRPTPFYPDHSVATIVIESSDSEEDSVSKTNKQLGGLISLDSDDSVLNTLKIDKEDPFDRLKRSCNRPRSITNSSVDSGQSSPRRVGGVTKKSSRRLGKFRNSSGSSSSTHYSPDSDISKSSGRLMRQKIVISESSSNEEEVLSKTKRNHSKGYTERSKLNSSGRSKRKTSSSSDSLSPKVNNFGNVTCRSSIKCQTTLAKPYDSVKLTKKDAEGLFKAKGGNPYWTPKLGLPLLKQESESLASNSQGVKNGKIINETASELVMSKSSSEDEIISNSSPDLKPANCKTHISRFVNLPDQEQQYAILSSTKKTEISRWLMNNTPGSSSSSSIVSESNRNSSFGNSSLERFELKHETPNNRGKLSKSNTLEKTKSIPKGIERYIYKGKTSVLKNQRDFEENTRPHSSDVTPINTTAKTLPKENLPTVKNVQNLHIEDCADILDKLYGNVWRNKADAVLTPQTGPRIEKNSTNKEQSNTERRSKARPEGGNKNVFSSSEEDDFHIFAKDIRPNFNSTKKKLVRDSFIDDKSLSENSSESFYHTALTNPRESRGNQRLPKQTAVSLSTKRAMAICDSDSDLDEQHYPQISENDLNKKRLSFSEDESDTSTSEFDPGELVLPKPKAKKAPTKTIRQAVKASEGQGLSKPSVLDKRSKSFLASLSATVPIHNCHPEARVYRDNYKTKKEELCRYLFQLYNKEVFEQKLPNDMAIEWNLRMRGTAGFCYNKKSVKALGGVIRSSRIVLATKILDTPDRLRDTLIHEMCHAAAWLINNVSDGHGPFWKGWASKAVKVFPELPPIKRCHDYKIKTKFTYRCTKCGYSIGRHSKSLDIESKRCGHCYGKFELLVNRTTRSGTTQVSTPVQARSATGFALFVKENYHSVKKDRRSIKHGEVMKILGQQFSAFKIGKKVDNAGI